MATQKTQTNKTPKGEKKALQYLGFVTSKVSKKGQAYYSGVVDAIELVAFPRSIEDVKLYPKRPDLSFYYRDDIEEKNVYVMSLWALLSEKTKQLYYSGTLKRDGEEKPLRIVGFIDKNDNRVINIYKSEQR